MKKVIMIAACCTILLSSCGTYAGVGAGTGAYFGGHLGSAIGGLTGGYRGHALGTIIGMASGAAIGAAVGAEKDAELERQHEQYYERRNHRIRSRHEGMTREHREYETPAYDMQSIAEPIQEGVTLRNLQVHIDGGNTMQRGGEAKITFELMNTSETALYDVMPEVTLSTPSKHIFISPNINIECITPGEGVRYTAHIKTTKYVRPGTYTFNITARQDGFFITKSQQVQIDIVK